MGFFYFLLLPGLVKTLASSIMSSETIQVLSSLFCGSLTVLVPSSHVRHRSLPRVRICVLIFRKSGSFTLANPQIKL